MAQTLAFVRGGTTRSLLDPGTGMAIRHEWTPKVARPAYGKDPPDITEDMPIWIQDTSDDALATELQELHEMQRWAEMYRVDRTEDTPVWLEDQTIGETNKRRALVKQIIGDFSLGWHYEDIPDHHIEMPMQVVRAPYWERDSARSLPQYRPAAAAAYLYDYTAAGAGIGAHDIVGDVGARIDQFNCNYTTAVLGWLWAGIRSVNKVSTPSNLVVLWEYEDAGATVHVGALGADGNASGGQRLRVTAAGAPTWTKIHSIELADVTANYTDHYGRFLWLCRAQVTTGTWEIQFRYNYNPCPDAVAIPGPITEVTTTAYMYHDMGLQSIPMRNFQALTAAGLIEPQWQIQTWARVTGGAGNLDLDVITPVPVDEGFFHAFDAPYMTSGDELIFGESPAGNWEAVGLDPAFNYFQMAWAHEEIDFRLPPGDGRMVVVPDKTTAGLGQFRVNDGDFGKYYERWCSLRGSE